jgi:hypothetical protein
MESSPFDWRVIAEAGEQAGWAGLTELVFFPPSFIFVI